MAPGNADKKTVYETFYSYVSKIFENVSSESWMNERSIQSMKNISEEEKQQILKKNEISHQTSAEGAKN